MQIEIMFKMKNEAIPSKNYRKQNIFTKKKNNKNKQPQEKRFFFRLLPHADIFW